MLINTLDAYWNLLLFILIIKFNVHILEVKYTYVMCIQTYSPPYHIYMYMHVYMYVYIYDT